MDALKNLSANIPDWLKRLEELSGQIEQRQIELAKFAQANSPSPAGGGSRSAQSTKSLRNKGSTESLRPTDERQDRHPTPEEDGTDTTPAASPNPVASDTTPTPTPAPAAADPAAIPTQIHMAVPPSPAPAELPTATATTAAAAPAPQSQPPPDNGVPPQQKQGTETELIEATRARARALVHKRIRSESVISADGGIVSYRSKSMVLVYYDSYLQSFFEELVKFVSGSRNLMRKAKMAAKVAHIKRMAELEMHDCSDDDEGGELKAADGPMLAAAPEQAARTTTTPATTPPTTTTKEPATQKREGDDDGNEEELPPLKYISTRQTHANSRLGPGGAAMIRPSFARASARSPYGGSTGLSEVACGPACGAMSGGPVATAFDTIDKGLEFVQSMCERAAHQFLRDGDCDEEIAKIKSRLAETSELVMAELGLKLKEGPGAEDLALQEAAAKGRSYRLPSMRRDPSRKSSTAPGPDRSSFPMHVMPSSAPTPPRSPSPAQALKETKPADSAPGVAAPMDMGGKLEADETIGDDDDYEVMPKLVYKSTRRMMRGGVY